MQVGSVRIPRGPLITYQYKQCASRREEGKTRVRKGASRNGSRQMIKYSSDTALNSTGMTEYVVSSKFMIKRINNEGQRVESINTCDNTYPQTSKDLVSFTRPIKPAFEQLRLCKGSDFHAHPTLPEVCPPSAGTPPRREIVQSSP